MKYMHFNSACAFAGVANMLERMGVDVSDRDIAMGMRLPYLFEYENGAYLGSAMLQSAEWFDLYLRPRGFAMREVSVPKAEICARLAEMECAMIGIFVAPGNRHAVVYTGCADGKYHFLNNRWEHTDEPDGFEFAQDELLDRLDEAPCIAWLERVAPEAAQLRPRMAHSLDVLRRMRADMDAFCEEERSPEALRAKLNPLFRALLLDGIAMLELLGEAELCGELKAVQAQLMAAMRNGGAVCLKDALPMQRLHGAIETYIRLIQAQM